LIRCVDINATLNPTLYNIVRSYETLVAAFSTVNGNYKKAIIFENDAFKFSTGNDARRVNKEFFGNNFYEMNKLAIRRLTYKDCFLNGEFRSPREFVESGLPLNWVTWMRLRSVVFATRQQLRKADASDTMALSINNFLSRAKKGSRNFRNILEKNRVDNANVLLFPTTLTILNLINFPTSDRKIMEGTLLSWIRPWLPSTIKYFVFRFQYNSLPLNNRISNFDVNVDPHCTFCRLADPDTHSRENLAHCFFYCDIVLNLIHQTNNLFFFPTDPDTLKSVYWFGTYNEFTSTINQSIILTFLDIFRFIIFKLKGRKILPEFILVRQQLTFIVRTILGQNNRLSDHIRNNNLYENLVPALG
jgi:hypothetical protein